MKALLLFLAALTLAGCSSHKTAASASTVEAETSVDMQVSSHSRQSADLWAMLRAVCDSLRLNIRADLVVVTPEGAAIVNPAIDADVSQPRLETADAVHAETTDSAAADIRQSSRLQSQSNTEEERDTAAIAKPLTLPYRYIFFTIAVSAIILYWLRKRKR